MPKVIVSKKALKQLKELKGTSYFDTIITFLERLQDNPFPRGYDIAKIRKD